MGCTSEPERIIDYQRYFIVMRNLTRQKIRPDKLDDIEFQDSP